MARLAVIAVVYLILIPFINDVDYRVFVRWVEIAATEGLTGIYLGLVERGLDYRLVYPPLSPLVFISSYMLAEAVTAKLTASIAHYVVDPKLVASLASIVTRAVIKAPMIAAVVVYAIIIKRLLGRGDYVVLLGPPVLVSVAIYDFDPFMMLFVLLAIVAASANRVLVSGALLAIAALFKPIAAILVPYLMTYAYVKARSIKAPVKVALSAVATTTVVMAPFLLMDPVAVVENMLYHVNRPVQGPSIFKLLELTPGPAALLTLATLTGAAAALGYYAGRADGPPRAHSIGRHMLAVGLLMLLFLILSPVVNTVYYYWFYVAVAPLLAVLIRRWPMKVKLLAVAMGLSITSLYLWYFIPAVISYALNKPYYWEEFRVYVAPQVIRDYIESSLGPLKDLLVKALGPMDSLLRSVLEAAYHALNNVLRVLTVIFIASNVVAALVTWILLAKMPRR